MRTASGKDRTSRILFIGGALNQTRIAHAVARHLEGEYECWFTPSYMDAGLVKWLHRAELLEWTALGGVFRRQTLEYLEENRLRIDDGGTDHDYDLVVATSDLVVPRNIRTRRIVLVQEGMTDPENLQYRLVRRLRLPRYLASTASTGLSHTYLYFCVASDGYKNHFIAKGVRPDRIVVTGLPEWDDLARSAFRGNDVADRGYALVATSDARETFKLDRRMRFLRRAVEIADGRALIVKLHPNENHDRAEREVRRVAPDARVLRTGNVNHLIAHCDVLITQYSTVVYTGLALGKECHSYFDIGELRRLTPLQNGGRSAASIARVCRHALDGRWLMRRKEMVDVCSCADCGSGADRLHATAG